MEHHLILRVITKILIGPIFVFGFYVQFHGDYSPGGGFQAGIILAVGFILYGLVFGLRQTKKVLPEWVLHKIMALGVLIYAGTGVAGLLMGGNYLDYSVLADNPILGQHNGILIIEIGVGTTVAAVMIAIFYAFAGRPPRISDEDW